ncbi:hypothetical protein NSA19_00990 [Actinomyces bowdenii]|uniref:hypothetical protein n=1 Tax=Actinomyces bowdenii TaxID=131109 RepID=UPI00214B6F9B|nr:hypothetical protein [Actinomyces bowdenii]MCR2051452.1 hypothetical protein [Actinomyces bowdenii]
MDSNFLKVSRAVNGDTIFIERVRIACSLDNMEYNEDLAIYVANHCVSGIEVDDDFAVNTRNVSDDDIRAGIASYWEQNDKEDE